MELNLSNILNAEYNKKHDTYIEYGTAGFRTKADLLEHVLYRMGLLAVLRSKAKHAAIGLMITASHNLEQDNGVKVVDPAGEMLEASWERIATDLANVEDANLASMIQNIITEQNIDTTVDAVVITGRDTRKSSPTLLDAALAGIRALNGTVKDFGIVTTPQLHYLVVCVNTNGSYGDPSLDGYYRKISTAFKAISNSIKENKDYVPSILLDAANGVGGIAVKEFQKYLENSIEINIHNNGDGELNHMCGADYVKVQQSPPANFPLTPNVRCVSLDGDADRVVYFYIDEQSTFHLLDGDRIATLIAGYLKELVEKSGLPFQLGLVQTAYANSGSTDYISNVLNVPVACVPTGIKYLHSRALEFDIGVYFEANGHGTVTFKDSVVADIRAAASKPGLSTNEASAISMLLLVLDVINQTVGDALSDMLLVETILHAKGWSIKDWEKTYTDLPNKQLKVKVKDKNVVTTTDAARRCVTPVGLQGHIDKAVAKYRKARSFVRPSGTENIVRVYAECEDPNDLNNLAIEVAILVYGHAGGIGPEPQ